MSNFTPIFPLFYCFKWTSIFKFNYQSDMEKLNVQQMVIFILLNWWAFNAGSTWEWGEQCERDMTWHESSLNCFLYLLILSAFNHISSLKSSSEVPCIWKLCYCHVFNRNRRVGGVSWTEMRKLMIMRRELCEMRCVSCQIKSFRETQGMKI